MLKKNNKNVKKIIYNSKEIKYIKIKVNNQMVKVYDQLPTEYQRVSYLESTGTQYINTGYLPTIYDSIETKFSTKESTSDTILYGSRNGSNNYDFTIWINTSTNKGIAVHYPITSSSKRDTSWFYRNNIIDNPVVLKITPDNCYVNNEIKYSFTDTRTEYTGGYEAYMFGRNQSNGIEARGKFKIYYFKIWTNNILTHSFIPCYRKSDNVAGMYDIVTKTFFINSGTGDFTIGAEI